MAKFAVFLVAKILKMHIFLTFLNGYIHLTTSKTKNKPLGLCPKPTLTCEAAGAGGKPYPPTPTVSVGSIQGVKGKMHDFVALTPLHLRGGSKTNRSGRSWKPVKACEATAYAAFTGWRRQRSVVRVQEVFPAPCHVANAGVGSAHGVNKTLGGRAVRENVP